MSSWVTIILVLTLIVLIVCCAFLYTCMEAFVTFVHIPKTGGSAIKEYLNAYDEHIQYMGHDGNFRALEDTRIVVIRDPIDRFLSFYKYWRQEYLDSTGNDVSLFDCIDLIKSNNTDTLLLPKHIEKYHYMPQSFYLPEESYSKTIVIMYTKDRVDMQRKLTNVLEFLGIPLKEDHELGIVNESTVVDANLRNDDKWWLYEYYAADFRLMQEIESHPEKFKLVV